VNHPSGQSPPDADPRLGSTLGGFRITGHVADGAMGRVYEAVPAGGGERVAVKVLHPHVAQDDVSVERFKREHETAETFDHPHIVDMRGFGATNDGSWYLVMEFLEGEELGERIRREGKVPLAAAVRIAAQMALALDHAHSFGVIHRDLKPDNVYLCRGRDGDVVKILDFGSVKLQVEMGPKLTAFGTTLGSPYYMSPEQAMGLADVDPRTDVFALASITYEMIAGRVPFEGQSVAEILMSIVNADPTPITSVAKDVPPDLDDVFSQALQKDKSQRFAQASAFASALARATGVAKGAEEAARLPLAQVEERIASHRPPAGAPAEMPGMKRSAEDTARLAVDADVPQVPTRSWTGVVAIAAAVGLALMAAAWFFLG